MAFLVYLAGPLTGGDTLHNVARAMEAADKVSDLGYACYLPHLTVHRDFRQRRPYDYWLYDHCLPILERCDIMYRISGPSAGADIEEHYADQWGIPVVYSLSDLADTLNEIERKSRRAKENGDRDKPFTYHAGVSGPRIVSTKALGRPQPGGTPYGPAVGQ